MFPYTHRQSLLDGTLLRENGGCGEVFGNLFQEAFCQILTTMKPFRRRAYFTDYIQSCACKLSRDRSAAVFFCSAIASSASVPIARLTGSNLSSSPSNRQTSEWFELTVSCFSRVPGNPRVADILSTIVCRAVSQVCQPQCGCQNSINTKDVVFPRNLVNFVGLFS